MCSRLPGSGRVNRIGAVGGLLLACALASSLAADAEPLDYLDRNAYIHNMTLHAHHFPGENRPGKMQMMALGERRYLFQFVFHSADWNPFRAAGQIVDVTDPTKVTEISKYSTDEGDPGRWFQKGSGTHRDWYDGGRYAYLGAAPGDEFRLPPDSPV